MQIIMVEFTKYNNLVIATHVVPKPKRGKEKQQRVRFLVVVQKQ